MTLDELRARQGEIATRLQEINTEYQGAALPEAERQEWNGLNDERDGNEQLIEELEAREERVTELSRVAGHAEGDNERALDRTLDRRGQRNRQVEDIWNMAEYRSVSTGPEDEQRALRDGARRALE